MTHETLVDPSKPISRDLYLKVVHAALLAQSYRFARDAVLKWLATYPGDLVAGLYYAQALIGERRFQQALTILEGLCTADPEFTEAIETLLWGESLAAFGQTPVSQAPNAANPGSSRTNRRNVPERVVRTHIFALTGQQNGTQTLSPWGSQVWLARQSIQKKDLPTAEAMIRQALTDEQPFPLACVVHLQFLASKPDADLEARRKLAERYHQTWPDCLAITLYLADWSMESGQADLAVALLHQVVARDVSGQVIRRMWGNTHPYSRLWPERLELALNMPVPADVAAILGLNRLPDGQGGGALPESEIDQNPPAILTTDVSTTAASSNPKEAAFLASLGILHPGIEHIKDTESEGTQEQTQPVLRSNDSARETKTSESGPDIPTKEDLKPPSVPRFQDEELRLIGQEFERLAARLKLPGTAHLDGRFPVYIIFSSRIKLESLYGAKASALLEIEMKRLAQAVKGRRGWDAQLFFADDPACTRPLGIKPARSGDPWEFKLALSDLDKFLARRGERIGALLIVGGPEVVPFHRLPNPVDDQDADVPSDNPYSTRDKNYFIPEWPVGRVPGGSGNDPQLLLDTLHRIGDRHISLGWQKSWSKRWMERISSWFVAIQPSRRSSFGYTAAVWQQAASFVFRPIGRPEALHVSPPLGIYPQDGKGPVQEVAVKGKPDNFVPPPAGLLGYFNLHGVEDAPEWFGQRDPLQPTAEPCSGGTLADASDYPVALRPEDISRCSKSSGSRVPQVVFSEACYGLHIQGKALDEAISLKFLAGGSQAVVGATCVSYGSIGTPLVAADLLGHSFWRFLQQGMPAGEALRQAKITLASEMDRRQGYLDGEDQKTLISFILYGDPLAQPVRSGLTPKSVRYLDKPLAGVKTVCDRVDFPDASLPVPAEVMVSVRQVVARCLPGMYDARLAYTRERDHCEGGSHACPTSQLESTHPAPAAGSSQRAASPATESRSSGGAQPKDTTQEEQHLSRSLVTLSKKVERKEGVFSLYARLTLDEQGHLVKLVVSR